MATEESGSEAIRSGSGLQSLHEASQDRQGLRQTLEAFLRQEVGERLGREPHELDELEGFFDAGLDSLTATEIRIALSSDLGLALPSSLLFDYPNLRELVDELCRRVIVEGVSELAEASRSSERVVETRGDRREVASGGVAIVGMGCRFPGGANSPEAYWKLLAEGVDASSEVPDELWDREAMFDPDADAPGRIATMRGSFLKGKELFDSGFFKIAPREASWSDPQQRMLLEVAWEALEDAGIPLESLRGTDVGVFVGAATHDYLTHVASEVREDEFDVSCVTGIAAAACAGRIAYAFGLQGPALTIDTACSSSLVAMHLARESLLRGECDAAIAGATALILSPLLHLFSSRARMLAPDGRCKPFDEGADGYGRAEGVGAIMLKRTEDAIRDGDRIWAVLAGSAVNQDGASGGLTVPNGPSQSRVIRRALRSARLSPADIEYVEAHGTGTPLGDPVEMNALGEVFASTRSADRPLWVGSAKSNVGHMEAAAGIGGVIKAALQIHKGMIVPSLHFRQPSSRIDWQGVCAEVPTSLVSWPAGRPRRSGVSSFGVTGTNAHVVLAEAPEPRAEARPEANPEEDTRAELIVVSGKSPEALEEN
ncbi:MAG: beta-ketoacyl synthase N-terminal-like domain-containing protein, partial [Myxococcales bacterium]|nr:beta-ketoacyl synthase N-terminal-like domain-containing protein [Myxococcales bacterium]